MPSLGVLRRNADKASRSPVAPLAQPVFGGEQPLPFRDSEACATRARGAGCQRRRVSVDAGVVVQIRLE